MSKVPKLRFPEFEGEWEEKELGEVGDVTASGDLEADSFSKELTEQHIYPIYSNAIVDEGLYGYSTHFKHLPNSITITARGTLGVAFVRQTKFTGIGRLLVVSNIVNSDASFLKENWNFLAKIPFENGGIPQLTAVKAKAIKLLYPSLEEQQKIADCLSSLDELIEARKEKIASLKAFKKGLLQQLFPDKVSKSTPPPLIFNKLPKLRFTGFEGEWEEIKLGEIGIFLSSLTGKIKEDFEQGNAKYIPYKNVYKNTFIDIRSLEKVNVREEEKQNTVKKGDILFTISSETPEEAGMSSVLADEIKDCYVNSFCSLFRFNSLSDKNIYFYGYLLRHHTIREYFRKTAQGSTRFNLSRESFKNLSFLVPKLEEQQKIADCLLSLDEKIDAETEQVAQLQQHKKGLLQQLLV